MTCYATIIEFVKDICQILNYLFHKSKDGRIRKFGYIQIDWNYFYKLLDEDVFGINHK